MATSNLVHEQIETGVTSLEDRSWLVLVAAVLPVPLTMVFFIVHSIVTGTPREAYGLPAAYLIYGLANLVTVGGVYVFLSADERASVFRFTRPSLTELGWAVAGFVVGLVCIRLQAE